MKARETQRMHPTAMALNPPDFAVPTMKFTGAQRRLSSTMIPKSLRRSIVFWRR